jgi:UDP-GlcNAc:undecaprenyl-phosphate GlcNAc-1-phosphate transferase
MFIGTSIVAAVSSRAVVDLWNIFVASAVLLAIGAIDDRFGIRAATRLVVHAGAAAVMVLGGFCLRDIGSPFGTGLVGLGPLAIPLTIVITVTVINAFNFIDGLDGLAASMAVIALVPGVLAVGGGTATADLVIIACGAILGFLMFNLPGFRKLAVRTFMGDAGSTFLGFTIVWSTIAISQGPARSLSPVLALWFVLIPLADFFNCFVRRIAKGKWPLQAGREHFHHILMRGGLSARQTVGVLVGFAAFYASLGVVAIRFPAPDWSMFAAWIALLCGQYFIVKWLAVWLRYRRWKAAVHRVDTHPQVPGNRELPAS